MRPSPPPAGASCAAAEDGDAPLASGVEVAIVAEELGRGLADAPFLGPTLAAELRRLVGAPPATGAETVALAPGLAELACVADGARPSGRVAIDAARCYERARAPARADGHVLGRGRVAVQSTRAST